MLIFQQFPNVDGEFAGDGMEIEIIKFLLFMNKFVVLLAQIIKNTLDHRKPMILKVVQIM